MTTMTAADLRGVATDRQMEELRRCFHEAGHAIAATIYGGEIRTAVVLRPGTLVAAGAKHGGFTAYTAPAEGREAEVTFAGPYTESRWLTGPHPTATALRASMCTNHQDDAALRRLFASNAETGNAVAPLIERAWPAVVTLARKLLRDGQARHPDVLAALGITDGGGPGSFQLANIRSGMRTPVGASR